LPDDLSDTELLGFALLFSVELLKLGSRRVQTYWPLITTGKRQPHFNAARIADAQGVIAILLSGATGASLLLLAIVFTEKSILLIADARTRIGWPSVTWVDINILTSWVGQQDGIA
jgi:hypothetical protein